MAFLGVTPVVWPASGPSRRPRALVCQAGGGGVPVGAQPLILQQIDRPVAAVERLGSIFQEAQFHTRFLTDAELEKLGSDDVAWELRDAADDIVAKARDRVLERFPGIDQPGGALYPSSRSEACWRDFNHFQRIVHYAVAAEKPEFTNEEGLRIMKEIYVLLDVPSDAMCYGVESLGEIAEADCRAKGIHWAYDAARAYKHLSKALRNAIVLQQ